MGIGRSTTGGSLDSEDSELLCVSELFVFKGLALSPPILLGVIKLLDAFKLSDFCRALDS